MTIISIAIIIIIIIMIIIIIIMVRILLPLLARRLRPFSAPRREARTRSTSTRGGRTSDGR